MSCSKNDIIRFWPWPPETNFFQFSMYSYEEFMKFWLRLLKWISLKCVLAPADEGESLKVSNIFEEGLVWILAWAAMKAFLLMLNDFY